MNYKMFCILLLTSVILHLIQPVELEREAARLAPLSWNAADPVQQGEAASDRRESVTSKGVLERRFRFRSRLNTHLIMLKFKR